MKGLINLKNKDIKCFKWCHVRLLNPQNKDPDRIRKQDKKIEASLDYRGIDFPIKVKDYEIFEKRISINVNVFRYDDRISPLYVSKKSNEQVLNALLITNEGKLHYVFIKDFNRLMYSKTKNTNKKHFCMSCLQNFSTEEILNNHKERCLLINGIQAAIYEKGKIKVKNYDELIPIPFKIYADS